MKSILFVMLICFKLHAFTNINLYNNKNTTFAVEEYDDDKLLRIQQKEKKSLPSSFYKSTDRSIKFKLHTNNKSKICILILQGFFFSLTPTASWGLSFLSLFADYSVCTLELIEKPFMPYSINAAQDDITQFYNHLVNQGYTVIPLACCFSSIIALQTFSKNNKKLTKLPPCVIFDSALDSINTAKRNAYKTQMPFILSLLVSSSWGWDLLCSFYDKKIMQIDALSIAKEFTLPCLFIHAEEDYLVPLSDMLKLYNEVSSRQKYLMISALGNHVSIHTSVPWQYKRCVETFIGNYVQSDDSTLTSSSCESSNAF